MTTQKRTFAYMMNPVRMNESFPIRSHESLFSLDRRQISLWPWSSNETLSCGINELSGLGVQNAQEDECSYAWVIDRVRKKTSTRRF